MTTLQELLEQWEARSKDALPTDAMLINKHIRELRTALTQHGEQPVAYMVPASVSIATTLFTKYN